MGGPLGTGQGVFAQWGKITGTLSNQTDLNTALTARVLKAGDTMSGALQIDVATTAGEALVVTSTDDNTTNNILEARDSSANVKVAITAGVTDGGLTNYDLEVGNETYGMIRIGNAVIGRTSLVAGSMDLDGAVLYRNIAGPVTGKIEHIFTEATGNTTRFAIPSAGVGNATYNPRSMLIAGPAPADTDYVTVGYWQANENIFDNLACDTSGTGADLGVQNDLEVEGDIFTDSIKESTPAAGILVGGGANLAVGAASAPGWQSMAGGVFIGNASVVPTGNPAAGGYAYAEAGALKWRGPSGTITTMGAA